jgi:hypothetical protein
MPDISDRPRAVVLRFMVPICGATAGEPADIFGKAFFRCKRNIAISDMMR